MQHKQLGKSDIRISAIIMGTWQAGKKMWVGIDDSESVRAIRAAFDAGITTFDTAEAYGNGHSEKIIARALGDVRSQVVLASKVFANHLGYDQVIAACERSLRNLNTDYIDLYQIHWPAGSFGSREIPIDETMSALKDLKKQGKILAIGVSNFNKKELHEASLCGSVESLQPPYSLFWRHVEQDAAPYCRQNQISILAYSSLAQGLLTGKFGPQHQFKRGDHRSQNRLFEAANYKRVQSALGALRDIAAEVGVSLSQLALAWVIAQPGTCAIVGARSARQAKENAKAGEICLGKAIIKEVDAIGETVTNHLDKGSVMWKW